MIFYCLDCDVIVDEDDTRLVMGRDEPWYMVCPHCGSSELCDEDEA